MESIGFWARLWLAFVLPWRVLSSGSLAARVRALERASDVSPNPATHSAVEASAREPAVTEVEAVAEPDRTSALILLAILQREGRLMDFLEEDITGFSDAEIGAAARVVHEGCKRSLAEYVELEPVRAQESEGDPVTLEPGFDAARNRVTGNVVGEPPFRGTLAHHGWQVRRIHLPEVVAGHDARILAPAEVEVP